MNLSKRIFIIIIISLVLIVLTIITFLIYNENKKVYYAADFNIEKYPRVQGRQDKNIDFRRVPNLKVYFERNQEVLTTDLNKIEEWQPGDIVVFGTSHIGIISDKRNKKGIPYLLHNGGQQKREEDILELYSKYEPITGHYRMK